MIISKIKYYKQDREIELIKTDKGINMKIQLENQDKTTSDIQKDLILESIFRNIHTLEVLHFSEVINNAYFLSSEARQYINNSKNELTESQDFEKLKTSIKKELLELINLVKENNEVF